MARKSVLAISGYDAASPAALAAVSDADEYIRLLDELVAIRRKLDLSQEQVAHAMGTTQSAVSNIERSSSNPRVRTLLRYARAVGSEVRFRRPAPRAGVSIVMRTAATAEVDYLALVAPASATSPIAV